jgi:hypothetical protein
MKLTTGTRVGSDLFGGRAPIIEIKPVKAFSVTSSWIRNRKITKIKSLNRYTWYNRVQYSTSISSKTVATRCLITMLSIKVAAEFLIFYSLLINLALSAKMSDDERLQHWPLGTKYRIRPSPPPQEPRNPSLSIKNQTDLLHLGGFISLDPMGISNNSFNFMMGGLAIKSLIDVGCARGVSAKFFHDQGARVLCVEASHEAVASSVLPRDKIVHHDFTLGPWWPEQTFDAAWSTEFVEHVGRQHMDNYLPIFHKSALIFITGSGFGGAHHVEVALPYSFIFCASYVTIHSFSFPSVFDSYRYLRSTGGGGGNLGYRRKALSTAAISPWSCASMPSGAA